MVQQDPMSAMLQQSSVGMNYKTVLCKNFQAMGVCKYGPTRQFAHGENDLKRPVILIYCRNKRHRSSRHRHKSYWHSKCRLKYKCTNSSTYCIKSSSLSPGIQSFTKNSKMQSNSGKLIIEILVSNF